LKLVSIKSKQDSEPTNLVLAESETGIPLDETRCHYDWACPYLSNDFIGRKPLSLLNLNASKRDLPARPERVEAASGGELAAIRDLLLDEWSDVLPGDYPGDQLCHRVHVALQGAPLDWTTKDSRGIPVLRCKLRLRARGTDGYGMAQVIAADVGKAWRLRADSLRRRDIEQHNRDVERLTARAESAFFELNQSWVALKELATG
jgi:hypothetical protein